MTSLLLCRYAKSVTADRLPAVLKNPDSLQVVPLGVSADLTAFSIVFEHLRAQGNAVPAQWDPQLAVALHQALRNVARRDAADMRFWHWLGIKAMPQVVWLRWYGRVPEPGEIAGVFQERPRLAERFLGTASLRGVSRNALARLWWCAETLSDGGTDYDAVREALANQDFFQAIFERKLGLYPPTARVLLRLLKNANEEQRRDALRRLNHYFTTIVAEALDEKDVERLLAGDGQAL